MNNLDDLEQFFQTRVAQLGNTSQATRDQYVSVYTRLRAQMAGSLPHTWPGFTRRQWLYTRAAITWAARVRGLQCIRAVRAAGTEADRRRLLREAVLCKSLIEAYPRTQPGRQAGGPRPQFIERPARAGGSKKRGGKASTKELRTDARIDRFVVAAYSDPRRGVDRRPHVSTMLLTGARPEEFEHGVHLARTDNDAMVVTIWGAKRRPASNGLVGHGQTQRVFTVAHLDWSVPGRYINQALRDAGGELVLHDSARALREATARAGRRAFGPSSTVTAYTCRHFFSAGLHLAGLSEEEIAAALGQQSTSTAKHYAGARLTGKAGRSTVRDVQASERVRVIERDRAFLDRRQGGPERVVHSGLDRNR